MPHLAAILTLAAGLAASFGYGSLVLRLLRLPARDPLRRIQAVALGMGTLGYLILGVGLCGMLRAPVLAGLAAAGIGLAAWALWSDRGAKAAPLETPAPEGEEGSSRWVTLALAAFLGLLALATLPSALRPVDGLDWDSLAYHLAAPKIYLREGRIGLIAYDSHTNFPFTLEMLYTLGLAFGGMGGAKLFHWAAGWLTAAAIGVWTDRLEINGRRVPQWAGPLAAALFAGMPLVLWEMGTAYVDLGTALFQFLALAALVDAIRPAPNGPSVSLSGAALAGILSGFALGTKYTALLQFGLLGLGLLAAVALSGKEGRAAACRATLAFGFLGVVVASPWYVKNWLWVHNPVYPFYYKLFPQSFSWTAEFEKGYAREQYEDFGVRSWEAAPLVLWNLGMRGREFFLARRIPLGDAVGTLGPVWAGLLPLVFWARGLGWRVAACAAYSGASIGVWLLMSHQSRYLMPVFAPLAVVAAAIVVGLGTRLLRAAAGVFIAGALALSLMLHAPSAVLSTQVVTGQISEDDFLHATLDPLHQAGKWINTLPENVRIALYQENRGFYFDRPYFWANPGQHNMIVYEALPDGNALVEEYRRFGLTHVLVNYSMGDVTPARWNRLINDAVQHGRLVEVFRTDRAERERRGIFVFEVR